MTLINKSRSLTAAAFYVMRCENFLNIVLLMMAEVMSVIMYRVMREMIYRVAL